METTIQTKPEKKYEDRIRRAIIVSGFTEGPGPVTAHDATNRIGGKHVFLNDDRFEDKAQRINTAVHELGHTLDLRHPEGSSPKIMQPAETSLINKLTTQKQRETMKIST